MSELVKITVSDIYIVITNLIQSQNSLTLNLISVL